jgi:hypothetical protein
MSLEFAKQSTVFLLIVGFLVFPIHGLHIVSVSDTIAYIKVRKEQVYTGLHIFRLEN